MTRASIGALSAPVTASRIRCEALSLGRVSVTRSGGGLGEPWTATHTPSAWTCGKPGKSEAVCPSGPMPLTATSSVTSAISSA